MNAPANPDGKPELRLLVTVDNKDDLDKFHRLEEKFKLTIVSTGGTKKMLEELGFMCLSVEDVTGFPEILGGRVKTLHPKILGGILGNLSDPEHVRELEEHGIQRFHGVVCNFYNFGDDKRLERIDIGGPTAVRAAAKNYEHCFPVPGPEYYDRVIDELLRTGDLSMNTRHHLAYQVFRKTGPYDDTVRSWFHDRDEAMNKK